MSIDIVTTPGNRRPSEKLKGMLSDLGNTLSAIFDRIEEIRQQAKSEGFKDHETHLLIRQHLSEFLSPNQVRYLLYWKPRSSSYRSGFRGRD